jgi:tRNA 5-methylaminomethyl-2-thiouridine biosynthesis bifunctional protein
MNNESSIEWRDGFLYSTEYQDFYHSKQGNLDEKDHVFIQGNHLQIAWKGKNKFTIFELGFGIGTNFLLVANLWKQTADKSSFLEFISVEKTPVPFSDIQTYFSNQPQFSEILNCLRDTYSFPTPGTYRIVFSQWNIILTLLVNDIHSIDLSMNTTVDVWFLDGFAPAKNPEMWSDTVFQWMRLYSVVGTTCTTYSASSSIQRALKDIGFKVEKHKGFGKKREMIYASLLESSVSIVTKPWYILPSGKGYTGTAIIIGAGLAGTAIARSLSKRNWKIKLVDSENNIAMQTSGNKAGIVCPKLTAEETLFSKLSVSGFFYFLQEVKQLESDGFKTGWHPKGVLELFLTTELSKVNRGITVHSLLDTTVKVLSSTEVNTMVSRTDGKYSGLLFLHAGYCVPYQLCKANIQSIHVSQIDCLFNQTVSEVRCSENIKSVYDREGKMIAEGDVIVLANSTKVNQFYQTSYLPLRNIRGQIVYVPENYIHSFSTVTVSNNGYIIPMDDGSYLIGSSFDLHNTSIDLDPSINVSLVNKLREVLSFLPAMDAESFSGRVGFRTTFPDHAPIVGPVPDTNAFHSDYSNLWKGKYGKSDAKGKYIDGLYTISGLGSKGMVYMYLCSEVLASIICGESLPLGNQYIEKMNPSRFLIKELMRKSSS